MGINRTLIITSTVNVNSNLTYLVDSRERLKQYLESIVFYLSVNALDQIIICDNSEFDYSKYMPFFDAFSQKNIECLHFKGNKSLIYEKGKGYGEGEIMEYVIKNSKLLRSQSAFFKVTGRLVVKNIDKIIEKSDIKLNYFQMAGSNPFRNLKALDTRFYQCTLSTFSQIFIEEYKSVDDINNNFLEHCYYQKYLFNKRLFNRFQVVPIISGISGSTGIRYDEPNFKIAIKKFLNRIKF